MYIVCMCLCLCFCVCVMLCLHVEVRRQLPALIFTFNLVWCRVSLVCFCVMLKLFTENNTLASPSSKDVSSWLVVHSLSPPDIMIYFMSTYRRAPLIPRSIFHNCWIQSLSLDSGLEQHLPILKFCTLVSSLQVISLNVVCVSLLKASVLDTWSSVWWFWRSGTFQRLDTVEGNWLDVH